MTTSTHPTISAARLDGLLESLQGELVAAENPHRRALTCLGSNRDGWTARPYDNQALAIWQGLLRDDPDDVESRHHLAIMLHARAIDREQGEHPDEANPDWEAALVHWAELWKSDRFWDGIASAVAPVEPGADAQRSSTRRAPVDALRSRLPALLLRLHLDAALDPSTSHYRAKYHLGRVIRAPFPDEAKADVRRATYESLAAEIPGEVWANHVLDVARIDAGVAVIKRYLDVDPDCEAALIDALRLQVRRLFAEVDQINAVGFAAAAERQGVLERARQAGEAWNPYFETLALQADSLADAVRRDLCTWYRLSAEVLCELGQLPGGVALYENGLLVGQEGDDDYERCRQKLPDTLALIARRAAKNGDADARAKADRAAARADLGVYACLQLSNAYLALKDFETAEAVRKRGLGLDRVRTSHVYAQLEVQARAQLLYEHAAFRLEANAAAEAAALVTEAIELRPDKHYRALLVRCHLATCDIGPAAAALKAFESETTDGEADRQELERLAQEIRQCEEAILRFDLPAARLRSGAARESKAQKYAEAASMLREAARTCPVRARAELEAEMSEVLTLWAIVEANATSADASVDAQEKLERQIGCQKRLEEACLLDPKNESAATNLKIIGDVVSAARDLAALHQRIGGEALDLRSQARERIYAKDPAGARALFERALACCLIAGKAELQSELSELLTSWAIDEVNAALADNKTDHDRLTAYRPALRRLKEAHRVAPGYKRAEENLNKLRGMLTQLLLQQATTENNAEHYETAEKLMREAMEHCLPEQHKSVATALSTVLTNRAIDDINKLT